MSATLSVGRLVHYCIAQAHDGTPVLRPALIVREFPGLPYVNLQVFLDGKNDERYRQDAIVALNASTAAGATPYAEPTVEECAAGMAWRTSVSEGENVGQWRPIGPQP